MGNKHLLCKPPSVLFRYSSLSCGNRALWSPRSVYWLLKLTMCKFLPWEVQPPHFRGPALLRCSSTLYLLVAALGLSCSLQDLHCRIWDPLLWPKGFSLVVALGLSCPVACAILVPQPGIEPVSAALESGFLTSGPPVKSPVSPYFLSFSS